MSETGTNDSGLRAVASERATDAYAYAQRSLDRYVDPSSRQRAYDSASAMAHDRPIIFSFLAAQLVFSSLPILTFAVFALSTMALALAGALLFALFWTGVALLFLVPALLVTSSVAVLVWAWAVGSFVVARALYARLPGGIKGAQEETALIEGRKSKTYSQAVKEENGVDGDAGKTS